MSVYVLEVCVEAVAFLLDDVVDVVLLGLEELHLLDGVVAAQVALVVLGELVTGRAHVISILLEVEQDIGYVVVEF
jgi:hypothetical protein